MAGRNRQPIDLLIAKGKKNLTKQEIDTRRKQEIKAPSDNVEPPSHLTSAQKKEFETKVKIKVKVTMQINMPFVSKETTVKTSVPIVMKIIQGTIPDYYLKNDSLNK